MTKNYNRIFSFQTLLIFFSTKKIFSTKFQFLSPSIYADIKIGFKILMILITLHWKLSKRKHSNIRMTVRNSRITFNNIFFTCFLIRFVFLLFNYSCLIKQLLIFRKYFLVIFFQWLLDFYFLLITQLLFINSIYI